MTCIKQIYIINGKPNHTQTLIAGSRASTRRICSERQTSSNSAASHSVTQRLLYAFTVSKTSPFFLQTLDCIYIYIYGLYIYPRNPKIIERVYGFYQRRLSKQVGIFIHPKLGAMILMVFGLFIYIYIYLQIIYI